MATGTATSFDSTSQVEGRRAGWSPDLGAEEGRGPARRQKPLGREGKDSLLLPGWGKVLLVPPLHLRLLRLLPRSRPPPAPGGNGSRFPSPLETPAAPGLVTCPPPHPWEHLRGALLRPLTARSSALTVCDTGATKKCPPLLRSTGPGGQGPSFPIYITHSHCQIQPLSHIRCSLN